MKFAAHPTDSTARAAAPNADATYLTDEYERIVTRDESYAARYGRMQVLCSLAVARVELLERQIACQEQAAASSLYGENVVPLRTRLRQVAPVPGSNRPGA